MVSKEHRAQLILSNQRGVSMLEMSIALIILMPILFGIIQWGLILSASITIHNTASVAAREIVLVTTPDDQNAKQTRANQVVANILNVSPTLNANFLAQGQGVLVQREIGGAMMTNAWSVTINYDLPLLFSFVVPNSTNGFLRLTSRVIMQ